MVFIFSGFVKAVDPLGSAYKFGDYFIAFRMEFLEPLALPLGIFLSAFELVLGISLILGYRRKVLFVVLMWFMSFFTLLTLVLALFNPVSDCGCFGDALILTNWETFFKNLILMVFVLVLYLSRKTDSASPKVLREWLVILGLFVSVSFFSYWNYRHLPLMDFRPYDVGTLIREEMEIPEGAPMDEYQTTLIYRNRLSGQTSSFTLEDYPKDTLKWEFVDSESRLVKRGYEPPIHDFAILDPEGYDLVESILADKDYSMLLLSYDLNTADREALIDAGEWAQLELFASDFSFYAVTAATSADVESVRAELGLGYAFLAGDEIMLKTIVRSNPGFMLIKNGIILGKWAFRDLPGLEELDPQWAELIGNASAPVDEETQLLMDAGAYDAMSFNLIEFEHVIPELLLDTDVNKQERRAVLAFVLTLMVVFLLAGRISPLRL
jgi:hypothetical protein